MVIKHTLTLKTGEGGLVKVQVSSNGWPSADGLAKIVWEKLMKEMVSDSEKVTLDSW